MECKQVRKQKYIEWIICETMLWLVQMKLLLWLHRRTLKCLKRDNIGISYFNKAKPNFCLFFFLIYFNWRLIALQYCGGFGHTLTWISHGCISVPHPKPSSHLPPHPIPQCHPSASALRTLYHASNLNWQFVSHLIIYVFQSHSPKPSHPCPLPQSPKDCSRYLSIFCCLAYRVIINIFLNSICTH